VDKEVILVVDDSRQMGDFIAYRLLPNMGYSGRIAYTGKTALASIHSSPPALMLLDLNLPDVSGLDILRHLSSEGIHIPTILFTAHGSEYIAAEAFRLGVQDYLVKPVEPGQLEAAITRALTETRLRREADRLNVESKEQVAWLTTLVKVGQSVTSSLDLDDVLRRIVDAAVQLTQAEEGFIALLDQSTGQFYLRAMKNIDEQRAQSIRMPVQDSLVGIAITSKKPVRRSAEQDHNMLKISTGFLVHSLLYVPIFSRGHPLGVLAVDNRTAARYFGARDEVVLRSLVDYAAVALENAHLYDQARREIAERRRVEAALRESEERYIRAVNGANDGLWDWNLKLDQIYFSPRWKSMLGYGPDEIHDTPQEWMSRVHPDDLPGLEKALAAHIHGDAPHFENQHRMRTQDGSYRWMLSRGLVVRVAGVPVQLAGSQTDITLTKEAEARLRHDALTEPLTQLPNRASFMKRLKAVVQRNNTSDGRLFALLYLDLDGFKFINDSLGHPAGDQLLIAVAAILKQELRADDMVARLGGDEFVLLLDGIAGPDYAIQVARHIIQRLSTPINLERYNTRVTTSASVGIVLSSLGYQLPEDVLRDADVAMYAAKARGKCTYELYDPAMRENLLYRLALEADLIRAVDQGQLRMFYQPVVALQDGRLIGFEALVQWEHPRFGLLPAREFIPIAQEVGLIVPINWWVFEEACRQAQSWYMDYHFDPPVKVFVNLTGGLIAWPDLLDNIRNVLDQTHLNPRLLGMEIKENIAANNYDVIRRLIDALRQYGVEVQIDNFGTGPASLLNLKRFAVDGLKIDQAFIQGLEQESQDTALVRMVVELAHEFGLRATAEGIETAEQCRILTRMGCDAGQGYLLSPLLDPEAATRLIQAHRSNGIDAPGPLILGTSC